MKRTLLLLLFLTGCVTDRTVGMRHSLDLKGQQKGTFYIGGTLLQGDRTHLGAYGELNTKKEGKAELDMSCRW